MSGLLAGLLGLPIRFYRRVISPLKPATCRFHPTCSAYALEALRVHGAWRGLVLGTWRVLRCQPFSVEGPDPVPPAGAWRLPLRAAGRADLRRTWCEQHGAPDPSGDDPA